MPVSAARGRAGLLVAAFAAASCREGTGPAPSLDGLWSIIAFESDGVAASSVSGTADFSTGGSVTFSGLVTFPGEPQDTINQTYSWSQAGTLLTLTDSTDTSRWELTFTQNGARVVMALLNDASASRLTLARAVLLPRRLGTPSRWSYQTAARRPPCRPSGGAVTFCQ